MYVSNLPYQICHKLDSPSGNRKQESYSLTPEQQEHLPQTFWYPNPNPYSPLTPISPQRPPLYNGHLFWRTVHTFTHGSTSLQWPLSCVPKVTVVERFNCTYAAIYKYY